MIFSYIQLEKKSKYNGLCSKEAVTVSEETVRRILKGDNGALLESGQELEAELAKVRAEMEVLLASKARAEEESRSTSESLSRG